MSVVFVPRKDQFAIGPDTASYQSVTFSADALVGALAKQLDAAGYSDQLHTALRTVSQYMAGGLGGNVCWPGHVVLAKHSRQPQHV